MPSSRSSVARAAARRLVFAVVIASPVVDAASAAMLVYNPAVSGVQHWNTAAPWSGVPGNATAWPDSASESVLIDAPLAQADVNADYTIGALTLNSGLIGGSGSLDTSGVFSWNGGTLGGSGAIHALAGFAINGVGPLTLDGRSIANLGAAIWSAGTISVASNTTIQNAALSSTLTLQGTVGVDAASTGMLTILNGGTLKYDSPLATTFAHTYVENGRQFTVSRGTLALTDGANFDDVSIASGATLAINGTFRLNGSASGDASIIGGTVAGSAGALNVGPAGTLVVDDLDAAQPSATNLVDATLTNHGTIRLAGNDSLTASGAARIVNASNASGAGVIEFAGTNAKLAAAPGSTAVALENAGIVRVASGAGVATISMPFTSTAKGRLEVHGGRLDLTAASNVSGEVQIDAGAELRQYETASTAATYQIADGATLSFRFNPSTLDSASSIVGGAVRIGDTTPAFGAKVVFDGATLSGVNTFDVGSNSGASLTRGATANVGATHVSTSGGFSLDNLGADCTFVTGTFANDGSTGMGAGLLRAGTATNSGEIDVLGAATLDVTGAMTNSGSIFVSEPAALLKVGGDFATTGSISLTDAEVRVGGTMTSDGVISGRGTIRTPLLISNGQLDAAGAASTGTITIDGSFASGAAQVMTVLVDFEFHSADEIVVTGAASVGGYLDTIYVLGDTTMLDPAERFTILQAASLSGDFASDAFLNGRIGAFDELGQQGSFAVVVDHSAARVYLTDYQAIPEPAALAALGLLGAIVGPRRRGQR